MHEVDLSNDLAPRHHQVLRCLNLLAIKIDTRTWCIVGGLMVLIAGRLAGATGGRADQTKDGDVVLDVVADIDALAAAFRELGELGYDPLPDAGRDPRVARCTVASGQAQVDLLAPDDAPDAALQFGDFSSIAIPGGRRALEVAEEVTITWGDEGITTLRVPTLFGALAVKAHACLDARTQDAPRHIQDVAFLLSAVPDPTVLTEQLGPDAGLLRDVAPQLDSAVAWVGLEVDRRRRAEAALKFL